MSNDSSSQPVQLPEHFDPTRVGRRRDGGRKKPKTSVPGPAGILPWNPWLAVVYAVVAFFVAQYVAAIVVILGGVAIGHSPDAVESWFETSTFANFWFTLAAEALTFGAIWLFVHKRGRRLRDIGWLRVRWTDPLKALAALVVYIAAYAVLLGTVQALFPSLNVDQKQELGFQPGGASSGLWMVFVSLVILPPIVEETVFRGFIFTSLRGRTGVITAAIITSVLFAAAHLQFGSGKPLLWVAAMDTFVLSLVLCYLRSKTGSLWPGIFLHGIKNCVAFVVLFVIGVN